MIDTRAHPLTSPCLSVVIPAYNEAATEPRIVLERHAINQGKGAALRTGFARASSPLVIIQDADLEYDPAD
jgi:glycosyltransferase involved in cell wall biosynthesis